MSGSTRSGSKKKAPHKFPPGYPQAKTAKISKRRKEQRPPEAGLIPITGKRPVAELLRRGIQPERLLIAVRERQEKEGDLLKHCRSAGWKVEEKERGQLDDAAEGLHHQGYVALIREFPYSSREELIELAQQGASLHADPIFIALDQIQDAGNLGAILRSAECAGVKGAIIPLHRSAGVSAAVIRRSAGAALHLPICRVVNLSAILDELKAAGFRIYGADQEGSRSLFKADLGGPIIIVIGSEERGLRPGVKRRCDELLGIPLHGRIASLNASAAAAVFLYEAVRQRLQTHLDPG